MSATTQQFDETKHPRGEGGRFTTKPCSEADVDLAGPAAPGEHLFGEASVRADRWGQVVTVQGPTLFLGAAIPAEHAQDPEYLDRRWHRIEAFVAEEYDAKVSLSKGLVCIFEIPTPTSPALLPSHLSPNGGAIRSGG